MPKITRVSHQYKGRESIEAKPKRSRLWYIIGTTSFFLGGLMILGFILGVKQEIAQVENKIANNNNNQAPQAPANPPQKAATASGLCSTNAQCANFGIRNCGGAAFAVCGTDSLCHCCLTLNGARCITCNEVQCGGGTVCMQNVCAFTVGGRTTQ